MVNFQVRIWVFFLCVPEETFKDTTQAFYRPDLLLRQPMNSVEISDIPLDAEQDNSETEETKANTTIASNAEINWSKLTQKHKW